MRSIVFSYDRACQLDLLIRSHKKYWDEEICVLYSYSNSEFKAGYEKLKLKHPDVVWVDRTNFKQDLLNALSGDYTIFFCDDEVMLRPFVENCKQVELFKSREDIICVSLRMDKRYTDYLEEKGCMPPPEFNSDNTWKWQGQPLDWGCPLVVSGNLIKTKTIRHILEDYNYNTPSSLEPILQANTPNIPYMIGFDRAININCPMNKVQTESPAPKSANISQGWLNEMFLSGKQIDLDDVVTQARESTSCFKFVDYHFMES